MNNALPFSAEGLQNNFLRIDLSNPPYVPNYQCNPQLYQFLPTISAALALEIQNNAQANPLRVFMFNQYSRNGFNNEEFHCLVCMTIDLVSHAMNNQQYPSLEVACQDLMPKMVEMLCVLNLRLFPALEGYVGQGMEVGLRSVIATFDNLSQFMSYQFTQKFKVQGGNWQQGGNTNFVPNNNMGGRPVFNRAGATFTSNSNSNSSGSVFNTGGQNTMGAFGSTSGQNADRDYGGRYAEAAQRQQQVPQNNVRENVQTIQPVATAKKLTWYPSKKCPYLPAYNPYRHEMILELVEGIITPTFKERDVDYDRHATGSTTFGNIPKGVDISGVSAAMTKVNEAVTDINNEATAIHENDEVATVTTKISQEWLTENSEETAWFSAELRRFEEKRRSGGILPAVYRCYVDMATPILASSKNIDFVKSLANAKAFTVAREIIANADDVNIELLNVCKSRLVKLVNRIIKQNLCIPKLTITDFVDDIGDLITLLKNKHGETISDAFLKNQKDQLQSLFRVQSEDATASMTYSYMSESDEADSDREMPEVLMLTSGYTLTLVNCLSYELEVELNSDVAVMIIKKANPVLHDLLAGLFRDVEARMQKGKIPFTRHLLKTTDGRILEATQGFIGDGACLLTLIK